MAASILSTEARHASWVASAVNKYAGWGSAFEVSLESWRQKGICNNTNSYYDRFLSPWTKFIRWHLGLSRHAHPPTLHCPSKPSRLLRSTILFQDKMPPYITRQLQRLRHLLCFISGFRRPLFLLTVKDKLPSQLICLDRYMRLLLRAGLKRRIVRLLLDLLFCCLKEIRLEIWLISFTYCFKYGPFVDKSWFRKATAVVLFVLFSGYITVCSNFLYLVSRFPRLDISHDFSIFESRFVLDPWIWITTIIMNFIVTPRSGPHDKHKDRSRKFCYGYIVGL